MIFNMTSPVLKSKDKVPVLGEDFTYTGSCEVIDDSDEVSGVQWRIKFYTSGTLVTNQDWVVDLFLVGGGGNGASASYGSVGGGGGGGYTGTFRQLTITAQESYSVVIGGSGGVSSALGQSVNGGGGGGTSSKGSAGGSGGGGGGDKYAITDAFKLGAAGGSDGSNGGKSYYDGGAGQGSTTREFGETSAALYSGGGGGGSYSGVTGAHGAGGAGGGGNGNNAGANQSGYPGTTNTGGGGGGCSYGGTPGAGGSGIAIIRKAKN